VEAMKIKLMHNCISNEEIAAINRVIESGEYTQGKIVREFENKFAEWNNSKYGVMVNSGSSANLLIISLLKEKYGLKDGDEVLVPAVTWPTTIYPVIQHNLIPVFCDVDESFNISLESMQKMTSEKTKALFLVHLLGQAGNMDEIGKFCKEKNIILVEDCCESLGATFKDKKVGNFGVMGSFSFYFGHHISTIEGGMITTDDLETYDLLKSIRSHGWIRDSLRMKHYEKEYSNLDYIFDYMGYNVRSTNLNAAIGIEQLKKIDSSIRIRKNNHRIFNELMLSNKKVKLQGISLSENSSFCLPLIVPTKEYRDNLLIKLREHGIESRSVVGGSLVKQPVFVKKLKGKYRADVCPNAETIDLCGLYLPNNQFIDEEKVKYMAEKINVILDGGVPF